MALATLASPETPEAWTPRWYTMLQQETKGMSPKDKAKHLWVHGFRPTFTAATTLSIPSLSKPGTTNTLTELPGGGYVCDCPSHKACYHLYLCKLAGYVFSGAQYERVTGDDARNLVT